MTSTEVRPLWFSAPHLLIFVCVHYERTRWRKLTEEESNCISREHLLRREGSWKTIFVYHIFGRKMSRLINDSRCSNEGSVPALSAGQRSVRLVLSTAP